MKRCPECRRDYYDDTLLYCLDDGNALLEGPASVDEPATAILSEPGAIATGFPASESPTKPQINTTDETAILPAEIAYIKTRRHRSVRKVLILVVLLVILVTAGFFGLYKFFGRKNAPFQSIKITKLTNIGNATAAQISPNGEYVAHVLYEGGKNSIRVWDVATKSNVEIVPPTEDNLIVSTFSPDSRYVFFGTPSGLYQVPVLGGTPRKMLEKGTGGVSVSPDGKQLTFVRRDFGTGETSLWIADIDGSAERVVATRKAEERFGTYEPAWSPDGKVIAVVIFVDGTYTTLAAVTVADGSVKPITSQKWWAVFRAVWLSDGSGLIVSAVDKNIPQIWHVSYPSGEVRRITNDANTYGAGSISVTADSSTIATIQQDTTSSIYVASIDDLARARQITRVTSSGAEPYGLAWTPDGRLVYASTATGSSEIWIMNGDGTASRQLTNDASYAGGPAASPDGRYIVFDSIRTGPSHIWRMDLDGSHLKQLTNGTNDAASSFSPDGRWVIYDATMTADLRKVSVDGGDPVRLTERSVSWPIVAPASGRIAGRYQIDRGAPSRLCVFGPDGGSPVKTFDLPPGRFNGDRWAADERSIYYTISTWSGSSLWNQSLDGGSPKKLADFTPEQIGSFAISRDGKSIAYSRETIIRDVILITYAGKQ